MATVLRSKPTTVTVSTSALQIAAGTLTPGAFAAFEQPSLSARSPHSVSGKLCDVTEDGASFSGHTAIDWAGKGCYDPVTRRVMWASCGAGNNVSGGAAYNTQAIYSEASNAWTARRGFQAPGESNSNPIVHMYDSNCLHVQGRRFYKKKFSAGEILEFDLDADAWRGVLATPSDEASYARDGGMDVVPTRGTSGAIWLVSWRSSDDRPQLWECDLASRRWSVLIPGGAFGAPRSNTPIVSYNPRASGGAGGVLIGTAAGVWTVSADRLVQTALQPPPRTLTLPHDGHLCRDPAGPGWLLASSDGFLYSCDGAAWIKRAPLPGVLAAGRNEQPLVMVPIDAYGVVWMITAQNGGTRAWLYKP
jgi:hypothetical protein